MLCVSNKSFSLSLSVFVCRISDQRASPSTRTGKREKQTSLLQRENECDGECSTTESTGDAMARASRLGATNGDRAMLFTLWRISKLSSAIESHSMNRSMHRRLTMAVDVHQTTHSCEQLLSESSWNFSLSTKMTRNVVASIVAS